MRKLGSMALESGTHWGCILRVDVDQAIKQDGWKWLLRNCNSHNFDGEIFGGHSTDAKRLREWGFRGSEAGLEADFVLTDQDNDYARRVAAGMDYHQYIANKVNWLEYVEVRSLVEGVKPFGVFKLKNSEVYSVKTFDGKTVTKGHDVDWPPFIGKIGPGN